MTVSRQNPVVAWLRLVRAGNVFISGAATIVGAYLANLQLVWTTALLVPWAPMLITAAGNIQNDLRDRPNDRISHPGRPLVTGVIGTRSATLVMGAAYVLGLTAAAALSPLALTIAGSAVLGLTLYNDRLSRKPFLGNLVVSLMGGLPVLYGGICSGSATTARWPIAGVAALIGFWLHLARELLKGTCDMSGDRLAGRRTLALAIGPVPTIRLGALTMLIAGAFAVWPVAEHFFGAIYLFGISVTVLPALLLGAAQCWWRPEIPVAAQWAFWLKATMLAGLVWMVLGTVPIA